jgi:hypothetical protein
MLVVPSPVSSYTSSIIYNARASGAPVSSTTYVPGSQGVFKFKPYNGQRGFSYDRFAMRIEIDQEKQYTTSMTETFNSYNITSTGLVASWSAVPVSVSTNSFISGTSTPATAFTFDSNAFIFNSAGLSTLTPFVLTTSFVECGQLDLSVDFLVGDVSNGGNVPGNGQNLALQFSNNNGLSYFTAANIWLGGSSNVWTYGTTSLTGQIITSVFNNTVYGIGTNFGTNFAIGDRLYFQNSSNTTAYTITSIINNNEISVTPTTTEALRSSVAIVGRTWGPDNTFGSSISRLLGAGTVFTGLTRDSLISIGSSTTTAYTVINIVNDTEIDISPQLPFSYISSVLTLSGTVDTTSALFLILNI